MVTALVLGLGLAGFAGLDTFQYAGRGVGRDRRPLDLPVIVAVTMLAGLETAPKP